MNAPPGLYRFLGNLHVAAGVTLQGSFSVVPSHDLRDGQNLLDGTILLPFASRGNESGQPFITIVANAAVAGFSVLCLEQLPEQVPVPYPFSVSCVK